MNISISKIVIVIAITLTLVGSFGNSRFFEFLYFLKISNSFGLYSFYDFHQTYFVFGEYWRLVSPTFLHFSLTHLVFNCLWIFVLGERIEKLDGLLLFTCLILIGSVISNFSQYYVSNNPLFGGLSGAVYSLLGFCYIREFIFHKTNYGLPPALYIFMLAWLLLGYTGFLEIFGFKIANTAHLAGLLVGVIIAILKGPQKAM